MHSFDRDADVNKSAFMQFCRGVPVGASQVGEHDTEKHYTVKKVCGFPVLSLTKLSLAGNNLIIPARESLVSDVPAGDGKIKTHFLQSNVFSESLKFEKPRWSNGYAGEVYRRKT